MPSTASASWKVARGAAATRPRREVRTMVVCMVNHVVGQIFHVERTWGKSMCLFGLFHVEGSLCFEECECGADGMALKRGKHGPSYTKCSLDVALKLLGRYRERPHRMDIQNAPSTVWTKSKGPMKQRRLGSRYVPMPWE